MNLVRSARIQYFSIELITELSVFQTTVCDTLLAIQTSRVYISASGNKFVTWCNNWQITRKRRFSYFKHYILYVNMLYGPYKENEMLLDFE